jgi:hypothetical protein
MNLETVAKLTANHSASPLEIKKKRDRAEAEQIVVRQMFNWITWGMIVFGIGVLLLVINKSFDMGAWIKLISTCLMLGGSGICAAGILNSIRKGTQLSAGRETREFREPVETKTLPATNSFPDALPSITERTTKLISSKDSRRKNGADLKSGTDFNLCFQVFLLAAPQSLTRISLRSKSATSSFRSKNYYRTRSEATARQREKHNGNKRLLLCMQSLRSWFCIGSVTSNYYLVAA